MLSKPIWAFRKDREMPHGNAIEELMLTDPIELVTQA
jgi:DNA polymerase IIIc chi subunit